MENIDGILTLEESQVVRAAKLVRYADIYRKRPEIAAARQLAKEKIAAIRAVAEELGGKMRRIQHLANERFRGDATLTSAIEQWTLAFRGEGTITAGLMWLDELQDKDFRPVPTTSRHWDILCQQFNGVLSRYIDSGDFAGAMRRNFEIAAFRLSELSRASRGIVRPVQDYEPTFPAQGGEGAGHKVHSILRG